MSRLPPSVLILDQSDADSPWYADFSATFRSTLNAGSGRRFSFHSEHLDLSRFPGTQHHEVLRTYLQNKYRGAATQVDCLLLDIHLGGVSGIELRRRLKDSGSTLPVIFMTALDDEAMREQALKAGCVAFLRKPFQARQLIDAIKKAVP
jgi:CheY-like chemotaxis protein